MSLRHTYFSADFFNPLPRLERLAHPYVHEIRLPLRGDTLRVRWTERAEQALAARHSPLNVEMQLYFSCVVKKRVLFPDIGPAEVEVPDGRVRVSLRAVMSDRCDPETFAANHPEREELTSPQARRMRPRDLLVDHRRGQWEGAMII